MRWEQLGNPSSHWTIAVFDQWYIVLLLAVLVLHLFLANVVPPVEDELYYWAWSRDLGLSYFDHPPMTAIWIRISTAIFGNGIGAIRFPAVIAHFLVFLGLGRLVQSKLILGLLLFTPLSMYGAMIMTPDIPLLFFWTAYLLWLTGIARYFGGWSDDPVTRVYHHSPISLVQWAFGGVILGLGLLSKYTMFLALPCTFLVLALRYRWRAWLKGYIIHALVAGLFFSGVLYFNYLHQFAPLKFQWEHTGWATDFHFFFEFLGSQVALVGALPFLMLPWVLVMSGEISDHPMLRVCLYFFILPLALILYKATHSYLEANWALVAYMSFWPVAGYLLDRSSFHWFKKILLGISFAPVILFSTVLTVHLIHPLKWVKPEKDRVARYGAQLSLVQKVKEDLSDNRRTPPIYLPTYQWTAYFRYVGFTPSEQIYPLGRPSQFTLTPKDPCKENKIVVFAPKGERAPLLNCFAPPDVLKEYPLEVRGQVVDRFELLEYRKPLTLPEAAS